MSPASIGIRLEGTAEQIEEMQRRMDRVIFLSDSKEYPSKHVPGIVLAYYRGYFYEKETILDQLEAAIQDIQALEQRLGELLLENEALKEQLNLIPKPKPYDAVLGGKQHARDSGKRSPTVPADGD